MKKFLLVFLLLFTGCDRLDSLITKTVEVPKEVIKEVIKEVPKETIRDIGQPYQSYLDAACRVRAGNSGGSGICFKEDSNNIYILTNRHVAGSNKSALVEFWHNGKVSEKYSAEIQGVFEVDVAILIVKKSAFANQPIPKPISISVEEPKRGDTITTVGCPGLGWEGLWVGQVIGFSKGGAFSDNQRDINFSPPPKGGQSGSGVFKDGKIVGLLWGSDGETGSAVSCVDLNRILNGAPGIPPKEPPKSRRPFRRLNYYFYSDSCSPCKKMTPIVDKLQKEGIDIESIDVTGMNIITPSFKNKKGERKTGIVSESELRKFYTQK